MKTKLTIYAKTDVGKERDHNEDNFIVCPDLKDIENWVVPMGEEQNLSEYGSLLVVADGMGGMKAGEVASKEAVRGVNTYFLENVNKLKKASDETVEQLLKNSIVEANNRLIAYQKKYPESEGMGTTLILGLIWNDKLSIAWSGDSRCYVYRPNYGLIAFSKDHSYVQELIDEGKLTEEQAFYHPQSNIVTKSLGSSKHSPAPDAKTMPVYKGDRIMLCSDGLNGMLQDRAIEDIFARYSDIGECVAEMINEANNEGGHDNITVVIADVVDSDMVAPLTEGGGYDTESDFNNTKKPGKYRIINIILGGLLLASLVYIVILEKHKIPFVKDLFDKTSTATDTSGQDTANKEKDNQNVTDATESQNVEEKNSQQNQADTTKSKSKGDSGQSTHNNGSSEDNSHSSDKPELPTQNPQPEQDSSKHAKPTIKEIGQKIIDQIESKTTETKDNTVISNVKEILNKDKPTTEEICQVYNDIKKLSYINLEELESYINNNNCDCDNEKNKL